PCGRAAPRCARRALAARPGVGRPPSPGTPTTAFFRRSAVRCGDARSVSPWPSARSTRWPAGARKRGSAERGPRRSRDVSGARRARARRAGARARRVRRRRRRAAGERARRASRVSPAAAREGGGPPRPARAVGLPEEQLVAAGIPEPARVAAAAAASAGWLEAVPSEVVLDGLARAADPAGALHGLARLLAAAQPAL